LTAAAAAGSLALVGFGVDSIVESASAVVVLWRLLAERRAPDRVDQLEHRAVTVIGVTFLGLAALVGVESVRSLVAGDRSDATVVGIGLTIVSLIVMPVLARAKRSVGRALDSRSVEADSRQTDACVYLSIVVLVGLVANAWLGWWWADPVAALGVVVFLVLEGVRALRAERIDDCC
jgi:divalent metal cation (Fe/Co/Zn/Cd) transporter